ncbi:uncharacterized protein LOC135926737 [Gordionus sp. m RMFG-2023]|uniref:uncharacterized protein LOC135926737 n=1 Tax=Gordionus sp. m RMFG-2023 TaxID=3053472 RepID=UPI0031FBD09B
MEIMNEFQDLAQDYIDNRPPSLSHDLSLLSLDSKESKSSIPKYGTIDQICTENMGDNLTKSKTQGRNSFDSKKQLSDFYTFLTQLTPEQSAHLPPAWPASRPLCKYSLSAYNNKYELLKAEPEPLLYDFPLASAHSDRFSQFLVGHIASKRQESPIIYNDSLEEPNFFLLNGLETNLYHHHNQFMNSNLPDPSPSQLLAPNYAEGFVKLLNKRIPCHDSQVRMAEAEDKRTTEIIGDNVIVDRCQMTIYCVPLLDLIFAHLFVPKPESIPEKLTSPSNESQAFDANNSGIKDCSTLCNTFLSDRSNPYGHISKLICNSASELALKYFKDNIFSNNQRREECNIKRFIELLKSTSVFFHRNARGNSGFVESRSRELMLKCFKMYYRDDKIVKLCPAMNLFGKGCVCELHLYIPELSPSQSHLNTEHKIEMSLPSQPPLNQQDRESKMENLEYSELLIDLKCENHSTSYKSNIAQGKRSEGNKNSAENLPNIVHLSCDCGFTFGSLEGRHTFTVKKANYNFYEEMRLACCYKRFKIVLSKFFPSSGLNADDCKDNVEMPHISIANSVLNVIKPEWKHLDLIENIFGLAKDNNTTSTTSPKMNKKLKYTLLLKHIYRQNFSMNYVYVSSYLEFKCNQNDLSLSQNLDFSSWSLVHYGPFISYIPDIGLDMPNYLPHSNKLLSWYHKIQHVKTTNDKNSGGMDQEDSFQATTLLFYLGFEYECVYGKHKFIANSVEDGFTVSTKKKYMQADHLLRTEMPLYRLCPCAKTQVSTTILSHTTSKYLARLNKVYIAIPNAPIHVTLSPKIRFSKKKFKGDDSELLDDDAWPEEGLFSQNEADSFVFMPDLAKTDLKLTSNSFWALKFPFLYYSHLGLHSKSTFNLNDTIPRKNAYSDGNLLKNIFIVEMSKPILKKNLS